MNDTKKTVLLMLITALLTCIVTVFFTSPPPQASIVPLQQQLAYNQQKLQAINSTYTIQMKSLQKKNDSLMLVINQGNTTLANTDLKIGQLQKRVTHLINTIQSQPDTTKQKISECDSLGANAAILIAQEGQRDTLCNDEIKNLTLVLAEKDSALTDCENGFSGIRQVADSSLNEQLNMVIQIKGLNKQLKRKVFFSRVLSVGCLILTSVSATLILMQQKR
jgi:hypothetical protein